MVMLLALTVGGAQAAIEMYKVKASPLVPAFIDYMLNCPGDVTINILPSDAGGTPTGPAVKTVTFTGQSRGNHRYIWVADKNDGSLAPQGWYVAELSATATQASWAPIVGLFTNNEPLVEHAWSPLPGTPDMEGAYGIAVNSFPNTGKYYGRIYAPHKVNKAVYMHEPDGTYIGKLHNADGTDFVWAAGGASAPWDVAVADDGYVYVCDRSNMFIYCFDPDGTFMSQSPQTSNHRAMFARTDLSTGRTYVYYSGSTQIKSIWVEPDHVTWQANPFGGNNLFTCGTTGGDNYGMWVNPARNDMWVASIAGTAIGVTKWHYSGSAWSQVGAFDRGPTERATDVSFVDADTDFLWVTKMVSPTPDDTTTPQNERTRPIQTVDPTTGALIDDTFGIVTWGLMNCQDGVGNVAVTFGKSTATWCQKFWGIFAQAGTNTCATKRTTAFELTATPAPVIVPDSAVWTADNTVAADNTDTASVSFKVMDPNGQNDITSVTLDLRPLGYADATACVLTNDADPKTKIATLTGIKAKVGARATNSNGQLPHYLVAKATDSTGGFNTDDTEVELNVTGNTGYSAYISHTLLTDWYIGGAQIVATGGGIPGTTDPRAKGPFVYTSTAADATSGYASLVLSTGHFNAVAKHVSFASDTPVGVDSPYAGSPMDLKLRPYTIAEVKDTSKVANGTRVNVQGVCYAQPYGKAPSAAPGLAPRTDSLRLCNQFYVCDPNTPAQGLLFLCPEENETFAPQWHDPDLTDDFGNSLYIGKRPAEGETIMITGVLNIPGGHETRVKIDDNDLVLGLANFVIERTYKNLGALGGLPTTPVTLTLTDFGHPIPTPISAAWGKYAKTTGATVVGYQADGVETGITEPYDKVPFLKVANTNGDVAQIAIDNNTTLTGITIPTINATYTFQGAAGRRCRQGPGVIRVRKAADIVQTAPVPEPGGDLSGVRAANAGDPCNIEEVVVAKIGNSIWLEAPDRSVGIRVTKNPSYVAQGDKVQVIGTYGLDADGEMVINPTQAILVKATAQAEPGVIDMRIREVGGVGTGTTPGVDTGRGALNVGLKVHVSGMVTAVGDGYYYIWDGSNRADLPVSDGSGNIGIYIEAGAPSGIDATSIWKDWVEVTGVVGREDDFVAGVAIPTILPTAAAKVTTFDTTTADAGTAITAGWNLMAVPDAPAGTSDGDQYSSKPWEPYMVLTPSKDPGELDGRMYRWENCVGGIYVWDMWSEVGANGPFAGLLVGDGYWLSLDTDWAVSYSSKKSALDQWIGICAPGWMIIGHPKDHATPLDQVKIHDGGAVYTMADAILTNAWIDCVGYWWDNAAQGLVDVGIPDCWTSTNDLLPWHGYWIQAFRGDLAFVVPEAVAAP